MDAKYQYVITVLICCCKNCFIKIIINKYYETTKIPEDFIMTHHHLTQDGVLNFVYFFVFIEFSLNF